MAPGAPRWSLRAIARTSDQPLLLDADAVTLLARNPDLRDAFGDRPLILTPHPGEMSRLLDRPTEEITADPFRAATEAADLPAAAAAAAKRIPFTIGVETDTPEVAGGAAATFGDDSAALLESETTKVRSQLSGLRGYGNLVILKHSPTYLTAYAHNQTLLVKDDQAVKRGQKIAEMGSTDADGVQLHFEIRKQGKPVDPARLLPPR